MRHILIVGIMVLAVAGMAAAQDLPKLEIFGGYSLFKIGGTDITNNVLNVADNSNIPGTINVAPHTFFPKSGAVSAVYNLKSRGLGIELGGQYSNGNMMELYGNWPTAAVPAGVITNGEMRFSSFSIAVGPRFAYRKIDKLTAFVHALVGINRIGLKPALLAGGVDQSATMVIPYFHDNGFAFVAGGGVDYRVSKSFSARLGQVDFIRSNNTVGKLNTSLNQNNLNVSFGVVYFPFKGE